MLCCWKSDPVSLTVSSLACHTLRNFVLSEVSKLVEQGRWMGSWLGLSKSRSQVCRCCRLLDVFLQGFQGLGLTFLRQIVLTYFDSMLDTCLNDSFSDRNFTKN